MVQGLGFLSKKSWHTKNLANQERVWMAEEREKAEKAKTAELAKQIQQEREEDELRQATGTGKSLDRGIAWLYDGHKKDSETAKEDAAKQAEEYLLGKPIAATAGKTAGDFDTAAAHEGVNAIVPAVAKSKDSEAGVNMHHDDAADAGDSVAHRNEAFRIRFEDPMYAVSLQSVRQDRALEHRKDLYERAGIAVKTIRHGGGGGGGGASGGGGSGERKRDDSRSERRRLKKADKKRKKTDRKRRKRYDDSGSDDDDDSSRRHSRDHKKRKHRNRSRSRSQSVESNRHRHRTKARRERSRSRDESPSVDSRRGHCQRRRSRSNSESMYRRSRRSRSRSPMYQTSRRTDRKQSESERDEFGRSLRSNRKHNDSPARPRIEAPTRVDGYGLQGVSKRDDNGRASANDLGPDPDLLRAKRESREAERQQRMERTSNRRYKSTAEREQARREMERDAARRAETRDVTRNRPDPDDDDEDRPRRATTNVAFLRDATVKAHGFDHNDQRTLSDRLRESRHRNQSLSDSFL